MAIVDDQGRIFGRFNLVDLALLVLLLGLIPLGYGAYALFNVPVPRLTGVDPATRQHEKEFRLTIRGENLRPYMRVSLNEHQGRTFLFKDPTTAEATFVAVPMGQFDLVLYDYAQERGRLAKAVTLTAPPMPAAEVHVAGFVTTIDEKVVPQLIPGFVFYGIGGARVGEVVSVGKAMPDIAKVIAGARPLEIPITQTFRVPLLVRVSCAVEAGAGGFGYCAADGRVLAPEVYLTVTVLDRNVPFLVTEVRPATTPTMLDIRMQLGGQEPAIPLIEKGDTDVNRWQNEFAGGGQVLTVSTAASPVLTLRVPAFPTSAGWVYDLQPLRVGGSLLFTTIRYQLSGTVMEVPPLPAAAKP